MLNNSLMVLAEVATPNAQTNVLDLPLQAHLLFIGILFLGTLAISRFSPKIGIPAILGVLLLGLSINVNILEITHEQASNFQLLGLALLLFYAGLKTDLAAIRGFLEYGVVLAVGGVVVSSLILGGLIWFLGSPSAQVLSVGIETIPLGAAMLIAACLGSTDAGATLSVLRSVRDKVPLRLQHLLEFESSVNDPSALLFYGLVVGIFVVSSTAGVGPSLESTVVTQVKIFFQQIGAGLVVGFVFGYLARFVINDLVEERSQLLVVAMSVAFVVYGSATLLGGSGFIAVYVTGLFLTNTRYRSPDINHVTIQEVLLPFNTMTEITIFLIFGLLVYPPDLVDALPIGLLSALGLMFVARPISVLILQPLSPFSFKESLLVSWCGLRGAVPLALSHDLSLAIPRIRGIDPAIIGEISKNAESIIFIVVVVNLFVQGVSLPYLARTLGLKPGIHLDSGLAT
ncbi:cation:proton antiporter [Synechococcus sp. EJ6-Ellesmere]|uniref:cation:proton antiporter domain-containing protein n=1 Tax=Synechococcus sp. EJ6-Ellesmere TaxID=2823734 RepID=UPI0020CCB7CD|nr:cation:proton antiporter [Synechococcus sp. EJ6-Ellesmere]MCP9825611.1 cation:proton antiporter [Synechococcus sp. EJ6-Ellesmere]